jgi:transposase
MKQVVPVLAGIDISAKTLDVSLERPAGGRESGQFANDAKGHRALWGFLRKRGKQIRILIEATGTYGIDLARALFDKGAEVMVINPRALHHFGEANLKRTKTDRVDAELALEYLQRMEFVPWTPPAPAYWQLRECSRRISALIEARTQEKNRRHASTRVADRSSAVQTSIRQHIAALDRQIEKLRAAALELIAQDPELTRRYKLILTIKGFGEASAIQIVAETALLPPGLSERQWVAYAGLDPRRCDSGTSVHKQARISKCGNAHLRAALYMPSMSAMCKTPTVRAFADHLIHDNKKVPIEALVAVMRKMLHAIWGMLENNTPFDPARFYRIPGETQSVQQPPLGAESLPRLVAVKEPGVREGEALDETIRGIKTSARRLLVERG